MASNLVADGDERASLQPGLVKPRLVLPRGTPQSAVLSGVENGGATVTRVRARDGPNIDKGVESILEQDRSLDWTTQAVGQQHTSPLRARFEARRREVPVICGCGNGLARDAPGATKFDGGLRAGGPQGL